jgi:hypothetical protein
VLRRIVKDHSDIKKAPMMRLESSVWILKENTIVRVFGPARGVSYRMLPLWRLLLAYLRERVPHGQMPSNRQDFSFISTNRSPDRLTISANRRINSPSAIKYRLDWFSG